MDRKTIEKMRKIEQQLMAAKQEAINEICGDVGKECMEGVTPVKAGISAFTVSMSAVKASGCWNLSPHYYSPASQAETVRRKLTSASKSGGMDGMMNAIQDMVDRKSVVVDHQTYALNPRTVSVLKETLAI